MTTTIVTRAGKGSELTMAEADSNFTNLQTTADAALAGATLALNFNPFRNRLINGDMQVSQVNGATAVTPTAAAYVVDQWKATLSQASKLTFQQVADAPAGFKYSLKVSVAVQYAPIATDAFTVAQPVEGQNLIDLALGSAAPSTIAVSVAAKASVAGTYTCYLQNGAGNRSYVGNITLTAAWARYTVVMVGDNTGTWATDNTAGLWFGIDLGSGSNFNATAGAWAAGAFTRTVAAVSLVNQTAGATLNFTGAQLEEIPTGTATPTAFEFLPYSEQLLRCQRYLPCWVSDGTNDYLSIAQTRDTTTAQIVQPFFVPTRVAVTGVGYSAANILNFTAYNSTIYAGSAIAFGYGTRFNIEINVTVAMTTAGLIGRAGLTSVGAVLYATGAQM